MPGTPYAVLKYCGEKLLNVEGSTLWSKMETGRLPMKYLFPRGAIDISVYSKKTKSSVHLMLPKVVEHNGAHELFMNTYVVVVGQRYYWRASEASETLSGVYKFDLMR